MALEKKKAEKPKDAPAVDALIRLAGYWDNQKKEDRR